MTTLKLATGFEHGLSDATSLVKGNTGIKYADVLSGTPTMVSSGSIRTGTYCLELNPSAAVEYLGWNTNTFGSSMNRWVLNFWLRFPSALPSADVVLVDTFVTLADIQLEFRNSDDKLILRTAADVQVGPTMAADTWYHVEIYANVSANPWVVKWRVDGTAQTDGGSATAATVMTEIQLGTSDASQTMTVRYDDVCIWTDTADITDYPYGKQKVLLLKPDTGGTAAEIGTANATGRMVTNSAIDATFNSANILTATSEVPPLIGASATGVGQRTSGAGNAVGIPMTTYTLSGSETISGLRIVIVGWSGSATTNAYGMRTYNGTTETTLFAAADPSFDNSTTSPSWLCKMATAADFDTQGELDALVVRLGYSTDISPLPGAHTIYAEVAIKEATGTPLTVQDATQAQTTDAVALTQHNVLVAVDATQAQATDAIALTQHNILVVQDALHAQLADNVVVTAHGPGTPLTVQDATQAQSTDAIALTQHNVLAVADTRQLQTTDAVALTQHNVLAIQDARQVPAADNVTVTYHAGGTVLVVQDTRQLQATDAISLTQHHVLVVQDARQVPVADNVLLALPPVGEAVDVFAGGITEFRWQAAVNSMRVTQ